MEKMNSKNNKRGYEIPETLIFTLAFENGILTGTNDGGNNGGEMGNGGFLDE